MKVWLITVVLAVTLVRGNLHSTSIWRNHHVVAASIDGYVCFDDGDRIACHRSIPKPTYKEIR